MVSMPPAQATLAAAVSLNNILFAICSWTPNPDAETSDGKVSDRINSFHPGGIGLFKRKEFFYTNLLAQGTHIAYYATLILTYPNPPALICPQAGFAIAANPKVFTWNKTLGAFLALNVTAAA